ncbi:MAG: HAMP domain-containing sensor histidine kinase [Eubacteriales bacterium]|nr:HAMP domain-containing sensor histidine kinase [Eubacteriales bacterium]
MVEEKELGKYILKRFVVTLIILGIVQTAVNVLFNFVVSPMMLNWLELDMLGKELGAKDVLVLLFLFIVRLISPKNSFVVADFLEGIIRNIIGNNATIQSVFERVSEVAGTKGIWYVFSVLVCFMLVVSVWIFPYIVAAKTFSKAISKRVDRLEQERKNRDLDVVKQRNLLLSDVAHDIKTPITTILGFSQALKENEIEEEKKQEYLDAIYEKSMKTSELVSLLFEYVKLDSEGFVLRKTTEDIYEVLRGCIARSYTDFEDKSMELVLDIPEDVCYMQVDRIQLERAFQNILTNAWKHNPEGTKLWVCVQQDESYMHIHIYDNGVRIETETAKHLFDPFVQGDKSRTGKRGSGLGLSITRKIIEMHGGKIRLVQYNNHKDYTKEFEIFLLNN